MTRAPSTRKLAIKLTTLHVVAMRAAMLGNPLRPAQEDGYRVCFSIY